MFKKTLGITGTLLLILFVASFVALPFVAGSASIPEDATAYAIGTLIHQFLEYWKEVASLI